MSSLAPIALFVYKRLWHTQQTVESLKKNALSSESELFIFSDAAKESNDVKFVNEVREYINGISGFKDVTIIERETNYGLANSIIDGVTNVITRFGQIIVLEDDMLLSKQFLEYMNTALDFYENNSEIISITGYTYPLNIPADYNSDVFVLTRASSWGWGTWIDRWKEVDWNIKNFEEFKRNKSLQKSFNASGNDMTPMLFAQMKGVIDSWAIRWSYYHFIRKGFCLYPRLSLVQNIGLDNSGSHSKKSDKYKVDFESGQKKLAFKNDLKLNKKIVESLVQLFEPSVFRKIINKIKYH